jgi:hypothetical protein
MKDPKKNKKFSLLRRVISGTNNFISRVADGNVLNSSTLDDIDFTTKPIPDELEHVKNFGYEKPDVTKALIDRALKQKSLSEVLDVDIASQEFRKEINKRVLVKNLKQKASFIWASCPMFKTLNDISIRTAQNSQAVIPINLQLYFGISMPAFVALHIVEHTLPPGMPRKAVQASKVVIGIPFFVMSDIVDKVGSRALKTFKMPDAKLDMQGTIGVPSDITLQEVFEDMAKWNDENQETMQTLQKLYNDQRGIK